MRQVRTPTVTGESIYSIFDQQDGELEKGGRGADRLQFASNLAGLLFTS
jgi:hypothetical protein